MKRGRGGEDRWSGGSLGGEERRGEGKVEKRAEARRRAPLHKSSNPFNHREDKTQTEDKFSKILYSSAKNSN